MSVTLSEVKRAARAHRAPLAGESAGYLVLAIADQVLSAPRLVQASDVQLTEEGALRVLAGHASSDADAELSLRRALDQLLLVASSGSAALTRAGRRTSPVGLSALVRELEAALIPVNRAAARRALARVHRETARALASGSLPEEALEAEAPVAAPLNVAPAAPQAAVLPAPLSVAPLNVAPPAQPATPLSVVAPTPPVVASYAPVTVALRERPVELEDDALTQLIPALSLPAQVSHLDGVLSALCEELPAPPELQESDALTVALEVRSVPAPVVALVLDEDVEFEVESVDSGAVPTVMRALEVQPTVLSAAPVATDQPLLDLPAEACTRPEPVVLRKSLRPQPSAELPPPCEALPRTPTLGSLAAQLPMLLPEQIAELSLEAQRLQAAAEEVVCSAPRDEQSEPSDERDEHTEPSDEHTEQMPEVAPLSPGVAMVASRKSDISQLLSSFQVGPDDSNQGLCRAIKEMADLDLTPAPFAALIR